MSSEREILLTPGPLTTSETTRAAMMRDWGSRDRNFITMTARIRDRLTAIAGATGSHICVPVQGSGTFAVEATLGTLVPRDGKILVLVNGAYGRRMAKICQYLARDHVVLERDEDQPVSADDVASALAGDPAISHVAAVHCETTTGLLNPIAGIADAVAAAGRRLIIDAMSSFGALPLDAREITFEALVASSNKCLQGAPGVGFAVIERQALASAAGNAHSLSLDLYDQWAGFEANGQWRFTPPTHVVAALDQALVEHEAEGSVAGRGARYAENCRILVSGMRDLGFEPFLPDALQAPIIITFHQPGHQPDDPVFDFGRFYDLLAAQGVVIYPGKLTKADSFRMGCIGDLNGDDMVRALDATSAALDEMGVKNRSKSP